MSDPEGGGKSEAESLRHSRMMETVLSSISDLAYTFDRDGRFVFANRALLELLKRDLSEVVGRDFHDLEYPEELATKLGCQIGEVIATGRPLSDSTPFTSPAGHEGVYEYIFSPVFAHDGSVEFVAGSTRDITGRHRAGVELARSESRLRQLIDTMPQLAWMADPSGWIFWFNKRWHEYTGTTSEQMEGWGWQSVHDPDELPRVLAQWNASIESGQPFDMTFPLRGADEIFRPFLTRVNPVRSEDGRITLWFGTNTDVSEQRRMVQERDELLASEREARSLAEHASRMKDEFLATLSHELRTPLNAIFGWTQLLKDGAENPAAVREAVDVIDRNVRIQTQLIEDLLDMSRVISGKLRLDVQEMDPVPCIEAAVETVNPAANARNIQLDRKLDPAAGPITGDPGRIQQIVWNLLSNAIKFTPKGGKVEVTLRRAESHVEIAVSDTGQGIEREFLPLVFDRFRQADAATTRRHGGLGLGLAIVKQLVELHGGNISVTSPGLDRGSRFVVSLPLQPIRRERPGKPVWPDRPGPETRSHLAVASLAGLKILVVDDEHDARELLRRMLSSKQAEVIVADSAKEALRHIERELPDILISDIGMAEIDGYELLRKLRKKSAVHGGKIPAIALTAFAHSEDRTRAVRSGFTAHISKPVEPSELVALIASVTGRGK